MHATQSRRAFLQQTVLTASALWLAGPLRSLGKVSPNEKLNLGVIGVSGRGAANLQGVSGETIAALCDVDERALAAAAERHPGAKTHVDFRRLLDQADLDAVVISTPDHTHAVAAMPALRSGRHVYCEKPLTRTVSECRRVTEAARRHRCVTQLGTQIHAERNYRRVVELIRSGTIGRVAEVHVWVNVTYGGRDLPADRPALPPHLHYDLWLGPVPERPYHPAWVPFAWRNWWAFGGGALADFGCHYMDLPHWALGLTHPQRIEVLDGPPVHPESTPPWLIVRYTHPARGDQPPVRVTWYHGGKHPALLTPTQYEQWKSGVLFVGAKGQLIANYGAHALWPEADFKDFKRPEPFIPNSIGHHREWIDAIKNRRPTTCAFDYSGPLTETALLGNVAFRAGKTLEWDWKKLEAAGCPEATPYIQHHYRPGWQL
ncbi:MAG: Gfo/Idh/MocA family oxidoreductase [Verrucomicrobia bacterium]|nr:Gfo/Idh/MocA family oxidoreductase [Verrucomicrobiota bacterium]